MHFIQFDEHGWHVLFWLWNVLIGQDATHEDENNQNPSWHSWQRLKLVQVLHPIAQLLGL